MTTTSPVDQMSLSGPVEVPPPSSQPDPQPSQPSQPSKFWTAMGRVGSVAANVVAPGAGGIFSDMLRGLGVGALGSDPTQYLRLQERMQAESRAYEAVSAVLKAKHDAAMDSLRNIAH